MSQTTSEIRRMADIRRSLADAVDPTDIKRLQKPSAARLVLDLSLIWVQLGCGGLLFILQPNLMGFVVAWLVIGGAQHGLALVAHEGAHGLIAPDHRALNDRISRWLFAAPVALPFNLYRQRHLAHHRDVSTRRDTKQLYQRSFGGKRMLLEIARSLVGMDYAEQVVRTLRPTASNSAAVSLSARALREDLLAIVLAQVLLLAIFSLIDPLLYFLLWLLPLTTTAMLWSKLRSAVEHHPAPEDCNLDPSETFFRGTLSPCLRSVTAPAWEHLFLTKINFSHHAEHHLWPTVSYQHLPALHRHLVAAQAWGTPGLHLAGSYLSELRRMARAS
jgi:fatty acid desaturase